MQTPHIHGLEANMQEVPAKEGGKFDVQPGLATHYSTPLHFPFLTNFQAEY